MFDLQLLLARVGGAPSIDAALRKLLPAAAARAMELSFDEYRSQVVAYLAPEHAAPYADRRAWDSMQLQVVQQLEELGR